ncbi:hypothetical protein FY036_02930 [Mesorhizobium microcysteis]|uniref:Uncharacterized protein n=1 Tax=Neoaquamicrobium microcysteis TaxID=2682781 RepID=A0A5D4H3Z5_9HYPH|nr:hypothetical protein [Mesorhizobium microcysteis]TYR35244.1 hypothetical protein FY036_02930 [Mesorhizobium microcysteis]
MDVGNTSLSLLIAAISVIALSADNFIRVAGWFQDSESADFTARISSAQPKQLTLTIDNDGPGSIVFGGSVSCDVYQTKTEIELWVPSESHPGTYFLSRYPRPEEVVARTVFFYGDATNAEIITPGTFKQITLPFRDISPQHFTPNLVAGRPEVKSHCTMLYDLENGQDGIFFDFIRDIEVSFFALDQADVMAAFAEREARIKQQEKTP